MRIATPLTRLRASLRLGAAYFFLVAAAHIMALKVPVLFVYFNVPSYAYQDKLIALFAFGWGVFLCAGGARRERVLDTARSALWAGVGGLLGLGVINVVTDFHALAADVHPGIFWVEWLGLCAYLGWLALLYRNARTHRETSQGTRT